MSDTDPGTWRGELTEVLRGAAGGFLFGIPLLYTLEIWTIGATADPSWLLGTLGITFGLVYLITLTEGFRRNLWLSPIGIAMESLEALGIGILCALMALLLLCRITLNTPLTEALGKLVFEGLPFSLGVALARTTLSRGRAGSPSRPRPPRSRPSPWGSTVADLDATVIGAFVFSLNIAPTDEITILAAAVPPLWLLLILIASLVITYVIVFVAGFTDQEARQRQRGLFQQPIAETVVAYLVSLGVAVAVLWFFHRLNFRSPWQEWLSDAIVLGFPAAIGGAAGRLVL